MHNLKSLRFRDCLQAIAPSLQTGIKAVAILASKSTSQNHWSRLGLRQNSSASEYVRELVRADQKRKAKEHLEGVLLEALKSEPEMTTPEWWAKLGLAFWWPVKKTSTHPTENLR